MPDFNVIKIGCIVVILLVLLIAAVIITVKREKSKRKIRRMCDAEKIQLLNELAEPFGFCYVPCEDVFTSRFNIICNRTFVKFFTIIYHNIVYNKNICKVVIIIRFMLR